MFSKTCRPIDLDGSYVMSFRRPFFPNFSLIARHTSRMTLALLLGMTALNSRAATEGARPGDPSRYNVVWDSPSKNASDSMPIGNGDIGLNVWAEKDGDLLFYIAKTDACSENSEFLKLGRVRVHLTPNPFAATSFRQALDLGRGRIAITAGDGSRSLALCVWVDANRPEIHVEAVGAEPFEMEAKLELWRTAPRTIDANGGAMGAENFGLYELRGGTPIVIEPDTVLPAKNDRLTWLHRNERSIYPDVLRVQHLEALLGKYSDPLLHRTFGCLMRGPGLLASDDHTLRSAKPATRHRLDVTAYTARSDTADEWAHARSTSWPAMTMRSDIEAAQRPRTMVAGVLGPGAGSRSPAASWPIRQAHGRRSRSPAAMRCNGGWKPATAAATCRSSTTGACSPLGAPLPTLWTRAGSTTIPTGAVGQ